MRAKSEWKITIHLVVQNFKIRPGTVKPNFNRGREVGGGGAWTQALGREFLGGSGQSSLKKFRNRDLGGIIFVFRTLFLNLSFIFQKYQNSLSSPPIPSPLPSLKKTLCVNRKRFQWYKQADVTKRTLFTIYNEIDGE